MFALVLFLFIATRFAAQAPDDQTTIPLGQVVEKVACARDPNQTYALYLPSNYVSTRKWPILYALDPLARGRVPVDRFKEAAERFGWIIVGSNNSRNGNGQTSIDAWNAITLDTTQRFSIDDVRLYTTGFSGGARMAILLATQCKDCVAGVIASGAGFPAGIEPSTTMHFALFTTAGTEDFNFAEVKALEAQLGRANIPHQLETFTGRHEWPPSPITIDALAWMELMAMKSGRRERDSEFVENWLSTKLTQVREFESAKKFYDAYQIYLEAALTLKGLHEVTELEAKVNQLRNSREVRDAIRNEQQEIRKQRDFEGQIARLVAAADRTKLPDLDASSDTTGRNSEAIATEADARLHVILRDLNRQATAEQDSSNRRIARRVISGQYIGFFEHGSNALQNQKRYDEAVRFLTLATEVDAERAAAFYYLAWAYNAKGDKKKSLKALQTAVDKGFSDAAGLESNKAFDSLRDDPQYQKIINALKAKH